MKKDRILLSSPTMHGEELQFVHEAFEKNWIAPLGFNVDGFEREMEAYLGGGHAAALNAGTAALHLAVKLSGVEQGDVVLCSDLTFAATINPAVYEGAVPVFVDSERDSWNMDPNALEEALKKYSGRVKAVMVVHLYGAPAKLDELKSICDKYDVAMIEDAAESLSATYRGKQTGTFGKYGAISFNGNKIITTSGGGMLWSEDEAAIQKARFWSTQSREPFPWYEHMEIGYNYRMSNVVAGIGRGQLIHLEEHRARKTEIYRRYQRALNDLPVTMNPYLACSVPNFWLSCFTISEDVTQLITPEDVRLALAEENIESRPIWKPMHMQPVFSDCDFVTAGDCVSEDIFARGLCLPSDIKMTEEQQDRVIACIRSCMEARI